MDQFIPGYTDMSPRTQSEKMSEYLVKVFSKGIGPDKIFAMADSKNQQ